VKECLLNNKDFQRFLIENGIKRVELNNSFQGYNFSLTYEISTSIYYPYCFTTITTKCVFKKNFNIEKCEFSCKDKYILCEIDGLDVPIFIRGNVEIYKNEKRPRNECFRRWNIDREVFLPVLTY
jgi:hypothetical protein